MKSINGLVKQGPCDEYYKCHSLVILWELDPWNTAILQTMYELTKSFSWVY